MSELMVAYSLVFRTGLLSLVLMAWPCLHEMSVVFAQGSADSVTEKAMTQATEKAVDKATEKTMEKVAEKAAEKAVQKATEKSVEKVVEKATQKAVEKAVQKATETTLQKAAAKAAQEETAQAELTAKRPEEFKGPTTVHFMVFVVDIDDIDDAAQNFTANVYLRLRWKDARLANPEGAIRQIPLSEVWNPRLLLANQQGLVPHSLPEIVQVHPDGTVMYHQRYTGKLSQRLMLADFPRDSHTFTIQFVAAGYQADELTFEPESVRNIRGGSMANTLSLADWKILRFEAVVAPYSPIEEIHTAGFAFQFQAQRYVAYYLWQVVLPLGVVVIMSWAAFWVGREHIGVRIAVATSSILTLIAHRFVLASLLPRLPYMTHLDYFTVGSTLLVLLALIAVIVTGFLAVHGHDRHARRIDLLARGTFPGAFLLLLIWFMVG
jgi:Neurotransmitter-gated ion-channel ligand binding domain